MSHVCSSFTQTGISGRPAASGLELLRRHADRVPVGGFPAILPVTGEGTFQHDLPAQRVPVDGPGGPIT